MSLSSGATVWFIGDSKMKGDTGPTAYSKCFRRRTVGRLDSMGLTLAPVGTQTDSDSVKHDGWNGYCLNGNVTPGGQDLYPKLTANFATIASGSPPNLIVLDAGTNDAGSPGNYASGATILSRVEAFVDYVLANNASTRILVMSQSWTYHALGAADLQVQNSNLKEFNRLLPAMIEGKASDRVRWADASWIAKESTADDVHPNDTGADYKAYFAADQIQRWGNNGGWLGSWNVPTFPIMPSVFGAILDRGVRDARLGSYDGVVLVSLRAADELTSQRATAGDDRAMPPRMPPAARRARAP